MLTMKNYQFYVLVIIALVLTACSGENLAADRLPWVGDGPILFKDDFAYMTGGWSTHSDAASFSGYDQSGFRLSTNIPNFQFWSVPGLNFQDVLIHTKAKKLSGPEDNLLGVICRYQDPKNFYALVVGSDGYYGIFKMLQGEFSLIDRTAMAFSEQIHSGGEDNEIHALCQGDSLALTVNGTKLIEVQDTSFSFGDAGLIAGNFDEPGVNILFDYFIVAKP